MRILICGEKKRIVTEHILYDLMELGLLNEKGLSIVQGNQTPSDEIVDEISGSINCVLADMHDEHVAISRCLGGVGIKAPIILSEPHFNVHIFARNTPMVVSETKLQELCKSKTSEIISKIETIGLPENRAERRKRLNKIKVKFKKKPL